VDSHGQRLEQLWAGQFGDDYVERNSEAGADRQPWWTDLLDRLEPTTALEVGCNRGGNLQWVAQALGPANVTGIDLNAKALAILRERIPGVNALQAKARELPFADGTFDLVYTIGVLIHHAPEDLGPAMDEIVRVSARYVMCMEYFAEQEEEVPYRGHEGALYRRDYGRLYVERHPELELIERGSLGKNGRRNRRGFDDAAFWIFERNAS
jgi:pseudaminic acid biosynthesis-associated methylase